MKSKFTSKKIKDMILKIIKAQDLYIKFIEYCIMLKTDGCLFFKQFNCVSNNKFLKKDIFKIFTTIDPKADFDII